MTDAAGAHLMPTPKFADLPGLRMAYYETGADNTGPALVFCHGFPELAFSWRHQLKALGEAGFHCIAPDQRGYGLTERPEPVEAYDMEHLTGDLVALLDHLKIDRAVFVGHDWGGLVVWQMPVRHPDRTLGVIGLNTPYTKRPDMDPIALYRKRFGDEMYIVRFQEPGVIDALFAEDVEKTLRFFMRLPDTTPEAFEARPPERRNIALQTALKFYDPAKDTQQFLTPEELGFFVETFERTGFTGGINWYRNFTRNWERSAHLSDHVACPALMIMAELDVVLPPSAADGMEKYVPDLDRALVTGAGHWTQQEKPEAVSLLIADWVTKRFR